MIFLLACLVPPSDSGLGEACEAHDGPEPGEDEWVVHLCVRNESRCAIREVNVFVDERRLVLQAGAQLERGEELVQDFLLHPPPQGAVTAYASATLIDTKVIPYEVYEPFPAGEPPLVQLALSFDEDDCAG
jgi:hypothetical protein